MSNKFKDFRLTEEQRELAGDNIGLCNKFVAKYKNLGVDLDYLRGAAYVGICKAAHKFDANKGYKFSTFATMPIRGYISDHYKRELEGWNQRYKQGGDSEIVLMDRLAPHNTEREADHRLLRGVIAEALECLNDKERYVITMFYSLHGERGMKLKEIAKEIGRTPQGVGMILQRCYVKIKEQDDQSLVDKLYQHWKDGD